MNSDIKVYNIKEVAEILKMTTRAVYTLVETGTIKAVKIGRIWRVTDEALKEFLDIKPTQATPKKAPKKPRNKRS